MIERWPLVGTIESETERAVQTKRFEGLYIKSKIMLESETRWFLSSADCSNARNDLSDFLASMHEWPFDRGQSITLTSKTMMETV